jgi:O-acetyl-ADP-ribose deacetylase (regulator of RNase III)
MKQVQGNLITMAIEGQFDIIVHGCNINCCMGSGIAKEIADRLPQAVEADNRTIAGDMRKMGNFTYATYTTGENEQHDGFGIINLYTQATMGRKGVHVDYDALERGFMNLKMIYDLDPNFPPFRFGIPMIGAGLGGGDWNRIKSIIEDIGFTDITYVEFDGSK